MIQCQLFISIVQTCELQTTNNNDYKERKKNNALNGLLMTTNEKISLVSKNNSCTFFLSLIHRYIYFATTMKIS